MSKLEAFIAYTVMVLVLCGIVFGLYYFFKITS